MKVEIQKEELGKSISFAERVAGKNTTTPILGTILLKATGNLLTLSATNIDLSLEVTIPAKVHTAGTVAVPAQFLNNFVSSLYDTNKVVFELENNNLVVKTNHSSSVVKAIPHDEFPSIVRMGDGKQSVTAKDISQGLKSVWWAATAASIKPELSSVYMYHSGDNLIFVATDSFRLAEKRVQMKKVPESPPVLIPYKNIADIIRFLDQVKDTCDMFVSHNQIAFATPTMYLASRVLEGVFPDYKQVIPKDVKTTVTVLTHDLQQSCKLLQVFTDKFNQTVFTIAPDQKKFEVRTKNADVGETVVTLDVKAEGEPIEMSFNHRYVSDVFPVLTTESVTLVFSGLARPMVVRGIGDNTFMYLLSPMNK